MIRLALLLAVASLAAHDFLLVDSPKEARRWAVAVWSGTTPVTTLTSTNGLITFTGATGVTYRFDVTAYSATNSVVQRSTGYWRLSREFPQCTNWVGACRAYSTSVRGTQWLHHIPCREHRR